MLEYAAHLVKCLFVDAGKTVFFSERKSSTESSLPEETESQRQCGMDLTQLTKKDNLNPWLAEIK